VYYIIILDQLNALDDYVNSKIGLAFKQSFKMAEDNRSVRFEYTIA